MFPQYSFLKRFCRILLLKLRKIDEKEMNGNNLYLMGTFEKNIFFIKEIEI